MSLGWFQQVDPQQTGASMQAGVAAAFALALGVVAWLMRRRLPVGLGEGAGLAAISAAVLLALADRPGSAPWRTQSGHLLTALAALWYLRGRLGNSDRTGHARELISQGAIACGLAALVAGLLSADFAALPTWRPGTVDLTVLLVLAAGAWSWGGRRFEGHAAVLVLLAIVAFALPHAAIDANTRWVGPLQNGGALATLAAALAPTLTHWQTRRRAWLADPAVLIEPPACRRFLCATIVAASVLIGVPGLMLFDSPWTPTALFLAGLASAVVCHQREWRLAGEVGLALTAGGVACLPTAFGWRDSYGALVGCGLAGGYMLWLARFWQQQLRAGTAWTTTGRLIPIARRLSCVAAVVTMMIALSRWLEPLPGTHSAGAQALAALVLAGFAAFLVRDGIDRGGLSILGSAVLVMVAATGPATALLHALLGWSVVPIVVLAAGASLLSPQLAWTSDRRVCETAFNAYIGGVLTVAALIALTLDGFSAQTLAAALLSAAAIAAGVWMRRTPAAPSSAVRTGESAGTDPC